MSQAYRALIKQALWDSYTTSRRKTGEHFLGAGMRLDVTYLAAAGCTPNPRTRFSRPQEKGLLWSQADGLFVWLRTRLARWPGGKVLASPTQVSLRTAWTRTKDSGMRDLIALVEYKSEASGAQQRPWPEVLRT